jgi:hypothetical protein
MICDTCRNKSSCETFKYNNQNGKGTIVACPKWERIPCQRTVAPQSAGNRPNFDYLATNGLGDVNALKRK